MQMPADEEEGDRDVRAYAVFWLFFSASRQLGKRSTK